MVEELVLWEAALLSERQSSGQKKDHLPDVGLVSERSLNLLI